MSQTKHAKALGAAKRLAASAADWIDLHNKLFGIGGEITRLFADESERAAFSRSPEFAEVMALLDGLKERRGGRAAVGPIRERLSRANGALSLRLPKSIHAALLLEAEAEGVSLNQLCLSKLVMQLRATAAR